MTGYPKIVLLGSLVLMSASALTACKETSPAPQLETNRVSDVAAIKKTGAPIEFTHSYDGSSELGEVESFELVFQPTQALDSLRIYIQSPDNILLGGTQTLTPSVSGIEAITVPLSVQLNTAGKYYLNILVETQQADKQMGRAFAVAIQTDAKTSEKKSTQKLSEKVHVMPAQEEIQ